jgi:hypothetical protein
MPVDLLGKGPNCMSTAPQLKREQSLVTVFGQAKRQLSNSAQTLISEFESYGPGNPALARPSAMR